MSLPWFRFYKEFAGDPKVQSMGEKHQRRLVMLLCLKCDESLEKLKDEEIAFALRITMEDLTESYEIFQEKGFIDFDDEGTILMINWNKRQFKSDSSTERVRKYRERKRNVPETAKKKKTEQSKNILSKEKTEEIVGYYHKHNPTLPKVRLPLSKISARNLRARFKENNGLDWNEFFKRVSMSEFLSGKTKDWNANFHWCVRPTNFEKIQNGEYGGKEPEPPKMTKLYCQEIVFKEDKYQSKCDVKEVEANQVTYKQILCNCKMPMVRAFEVNGLVHQKRKADEGITNRTRDSEEVQDIGQLIKRIGVNG